MEKNIGLSCGIIWGLLQGCYILSVVLTVSAKTQLGGLSQKPLSIAYPLKQGMQPVQAPGLVTSLSFFGTRTD